MEMLMNGYITTYNDRMYTFVMFDYVEYKPFTVHLVEY